MVLESTIVVTLGEDGGVMIGKKTEGPLEEFINVHSFNLSGGGQMDGWLCDNSALCILW